MKSSDTRLAGIDTSKLKLDVRACEGSGERSGQFPNDAEGHQALIRWLGKKSRVCIEATGVYHLQACLALRKAGVEVMVVNPRVARDFARASSVRSKTDRVDAGVLLEYVKRMEFVAWSSPAPEFMELRDMARRIDDLVQTAADDKKRKQSLLAARASRVVLNDVEVNIRHLGQRIELLEKSATRLVGEHEWLLEKFRVLRTIRGVGDRTALRLMAELLPLDPTMTVREIVAYAGLDPRHEESGTSVHKPARISRIGNARLRATLFLPALTLKSKDANARHFFERLVGRGKKKMQAIVAIMRKLLHAAWTLLQRGGVFDSAKLFPLDAAQLAAGPSDLHIAEANPEAKSSHPVVRSEVQKPERESSPPPAMRTRKSPTLAA